jgi:hypothetical protein
MMEHVTRLKHGVAAGLVSVKGQYPDETLRTLTLDLNYDRVRPSNGFSTELSLMLPLARFPTPHTDNKNYLRIYVEPGGGYRFGDGGFGPYASAKVMLALFSNRRLTALSGPVSPFIEIQHRFPFTSLHAGDTRIVFRDHRGVLQPLRRVTQRVRVAR